MIHHDKEVGLICVTKRETYRQVMIDHALIVVGARQHSVYKISRSSVEVKPEFRSMTQKMARDGQWEKTYSKWSVMANINPQMELRESLFAFCTRCSVCMLRTCF